MLYSTVEASYALIKCTSERSYKSDNKIINK